MKWLALVWLIAASVVRDPAPIVRTRNGLVRGSRAVGTKYYLYSGVPYATVNHSNRFQAPLPPPKWDGVFDAIEENVRCPQVMVGPVILGDPDCLKLNIYTPLQTKPNKLLPVMVFIHGGCFFEGSGTGFLYGGDFFVEHGVIFVGVNYRLNVEGFLCLGIKEAPGNAGLKDQIAALKWIRDNIEAFGGDPDNVTLFGESAGAVSTSYLILSPSAQGLFHKAILQSGATIAPWATQLDPIGTASSLVKEFGYDTKDAHEIYSILSNKTVNELIRALKYTGRKSYVTADTLFVPCVENDIPNVEPIVTEYPPVIIRSGNYTKVPMIIGFNDNEGIYFAVKNYGTSVKDIDPTDLLQADLQFPTEKDKNFTVENMKRHYFSNEREERISDVVDFYSDLHFKVPSILESEMYARTTDKPIYYYLFKYGGYLNMPKIISRFGTENGASHADELFYMFKPHSFPLPHRFLENVMTQRMVTLWTNFAKYSDPTPKRTALLPVRWRPSREHNPIALVIDERLGSGPLWDPEPVRLWNDTYSRYRRKHYEFKSFISAVDKLTVL